MKHRTGRRWGMLLCTVMLVTAANAESVQDRRRKHVRLVGTYVWDVFASESVHAFNMLHLAINPAARKNESREKAER